MSQDLAENGQREPAIQAYIRELASLADAARKTGDHRSSLDIVGNIYDLLDKQAQSLPDETEAR